MVRGDVTNICLLAAWAQKLKVRGLEVNPELAETFKQTVLAIPSWKLQAPQLTWRFAELCRMISCMVARYNDIELAKSLVLIMKMAMEKTEASPLHIVSVQVDFLIICITAKVYWIAEGLLMSRRLKVDTKKCCVDAKDIMLMYYYLGIVGIALKKYHVALHCLKLVRKAIWKSLPDVLLAAFEKFILVSLIVRGEVGAANLRPESLPPEMRPFVSEYLDLAKAFENSQYPSALQKVISSGRHKFTLDGNKGLVGQVEVAYLKRQVVRFSNVYVTLDLEKLASKLGLSGGKVVEKLLTQLVYDGSHYAKLNKMQNIVTFSEECNQNHQDANLGMFDSHEDVDNVLSAVEQIQEFRDEYSWKLGGMDPPVAVDLIDEVTGDADSAKSEEF